MNNSELIKTIVIAVLTSSGFTSALFAFIQKTADKKDIKTRMLIGLGHDRIITLGMEYIERGWVTKDEYENLHDYLYEPYKTMGGNGSAERIMKEVEKLPIKADTKINK